MKLLLVGNGKWGQNYINTIQQNWPNIKIEIATRNDWQQKVDQVPDGVMICTGPQAHVEIAKYVLEQHIPVMIEKPVALSMQELEPLLLVQYNAPILVNYIHLFANHFIELKKRCHNIKSIVSVGCGMGPVRKFSSLFDYASHDIAMCLELAKKNPTQIKCSDKTLRGYKDIFTICLQFDQIKHQSTVSNTKDKIRQIFVSCYNENRFCYDDLAKERLMCNEQALIINYVPPLINAIQCFIDLINGEQDDRSGLDLTIKVVKILEECHKQVSEVR